MTTKLVFDIETDGLDATRIWCIVAKEYPNGIVHTYTPDNLSAFHKDWSGRIQPIGHNIIGFDMPVVSKFFPDFDWGSDEPIDTLVLSKLRLYAQQGGHSLASWGERLRKRKATPPSFDSYSPEMLLYCLQDVEVSFELYQQLEEFSQRPEFQRAIKLENDTVKLCNELQSNGFRFDYAGAKALELEVINQIEELDRDIFKVFKPKAKAIRTVTPTVTKAGTLHLKDFRWLGPNPDLTTFNGGPFTLIEFREFNPRSPSQIVERLWEYGWQPYEKTKGHMKLERKITDARRRHRTPKPADLAKLEEYKTTGWSINADNLATLPASAPDAAHKLVRRLLLASRLSTLQSWRNAYDHRTRRIHGSFHGMGAWTHRMAHSAPNMANIPSVDSDFGTEMRTLWHTDVGKVLVGTDASGIQLRILAHYLCNEEFTEAVCYGSEDQGTDIHTMNMRALEPWCESRAVAKTFIYSWLLGAGVAKTAAILGCTQPEAREAREQFMNRYEGLTELRQERMAADAARGYFEGLDGRLVVVPSLHYVLAGYLQNGEAIIMKEATRLWKQRLDQIKVDYRIVNFVHDEWQTTCSPDVADIVGKTQVQAIRDTAVTLSLQCPMDGEYKIGNNWAETH